MIITQGRALLILAFLFLVQATVVAIAAYEVGASSPCNEEESFDIAPIH